MALRTFFVIPDKPRREYTIAYEGMVVAVDTRVICLAPTISNVTMFIRPEYTFVSSKAGNFIAIQA